MRVAVPVRNDLFCAHFGKCDGVLLCELDLTESVAGRPRVLRRQASGCESLPQWLSSLAVQYVLVEGIGATAQQNLRELGIGVAAGLNGKTPGDVIKNFLDNPEAALSNPCDRHEHDHHHCRSE